MASFANLPGKEALLEALNPALSGSSPVSLLYFDVDNFKLYNDTLGHLEGDRLLQELVNEAEKMILQKGSLYRYGGDEFCVLMPNTSADEAGGTGERLRITMERRKPTAMVETSLSVGVACSQGGEYSNAEEFLGAADAAMYQSKRSGGNLVTVLRGGEALTLERRQSRTDLSDVFRNESEIKIIYSELTLGPELRNAIDRYFQTNEERQSKKEHYLVPTDDQYDPGLRFRGTKVACVCEVRGAGYLAYSLAEAGLKARILAATSSSVRAQLHRQSFIAVGAKSNQMTAKLLENENNQLVDINMKDLNDVRFSSKNGKLLTPRRNKEIEDYGLIVRIRPEQDPEKTWIACAGLGEYGTSGAANFLAFSWWNIAKRIMRLGGRPNVSPFACIVRTDISADADDNAKIVNFALTEDHWVEHPGGVAV